MANFQKTAGVSLLSLQSLAAAATVEGSAAAVTATISASVFLRFGRRHASTLTAPVTLRVESSSESSGDGYWWPVAIFSSAFAAVTSQAVSGTCNSGQKVILMASTTGMTVGDIVYVDNGTIANSEWGRIASLVANTSITLEDNLQHTQTGSTVFPAAEQYYARLDLADAVRVRVVASAPGTTQACAVEARMITADSIS